MTMHRRGFVAPLARWLTACALTATALQPAVAQPVDLKFAVFTPPDGTLVKNVLVPWVEELNAALQGTAKVRLYAGGALGRDPAQQFKLVRDKVADISYVVMGYTPGEFPDATMFELPFLFKDSTEGSIAHWRLYQRGQLAGYERAKLLGAFAIPQQSMHTKSPLARLDDLKGMRIRSAGRVQSETIELLGASAVTGIAVPGAAEAISRGVVDGTLSDWNGMVAFRIGDVAKHHYEVPLGTASAGVFMNLDAYNALPPAARAAIDKLGGEALSRRHGVAFDARYREAFEAARARNDHHFVIPSSAELDAVKTRLAPVTKQWLAERDGRQKLLDDARAIVEQLRKGP